MKITAYVLSQIALFAVIATSLLPLTSRSIAYTTAYGALLITPVVISIYSKNFIIFASYALCALTWATGLYVGNDLIKIPGLYLILTTLTWWLFDQKAMAIIAATIAIYAAVMVKMFGPTADIGEGYKIGWNILYSLMLIIPICVQLTKNDTKATTRVSQQNHRQVA